jgi:NAD(P)-dependent dehydrogenase (short-subunit alcohol dehydrogenase family)
MTEPSPNHPAFHSGGVAVITGAASGIGLAAARRLAGFGLKVCMADWDSVALGAASAQVAEIAPGGDRDVMASPLDVADPAQLIALREAIWSRFGRVDVLMNNAGVGGGGGAFDNPDGWLRLLGVNLIGVLNGTQAFAQAMIDQGSPAVIVNTGSKQGITSPPGDTAYNVSKAGVKALTEGLAHSLRQIPGCQVTAHLLVPGFTYTGLTARRLPSPPPSAWTAEQVVEEMLAAVGRGDFYILCPDNETTRAMDERRIAWAAGDLIHNRPALSRWHPDYKAAFDAFMAGSAQG